MTGTELTLPQIRTDRPRGWSPCTKTIEPICIIEKFDRERVLATCVQLSFFRT